MIDLLALRGPHESEFILIATLAITRQTKLEELKTDLALAQWANGDKDTRHPQSLRLRSKALGKISYVSAL